MSKNRTNQPMQRDASGAPIRDGNPALFVRIGISLLLVWHLVAIFLAPLSVFPTSPLVVRVAQQPPVQWYLDALYINHGYHFFAPDPGAGHLIRYEILDAAGGVMEQGEFPNSKEQWPRLLYHRYFMLADQAGLPLPNEQERQYWERTYLEGYARHLLRTTEGQAVRLRRVAHFPLLPDHALQGRKLDDRETYQTVLEVVQRRSDLEPEFVEQSTLLEVDHDAIARQEAIRQETARRWTGGMR